jgi:hypothetical protein
MVPVAVCHVTDNVLLAGSEVKCAYNNVSKNIDVIESLKLIVSYTLHFSLLEVRIFEE